MFEYGTVFVQYYYTSRPAVFHYIYITQHNI